MLQTLFTPKGNAANDFYSISYALSRLMRSGPTPEGSQRLAPGRAFAHRG